MRLRQHGSGVYNIGRYLDNISKRQQRGDNEVDNYSYKRRRSPSSTGNQLSYFIQSFNLFKQTTPITTENHFPIQQIDTMSDFKGKLAIVTGASKLNGIGYATALQFAKGGADV